MQYQNNVLGVFQFFVDMVRQIFDMLDTVIILPGVSLRTIVIGYIVARMLAGWIMEHWLLNKSKGSASAAAVKPTAGGK